MALKRWSRALPITAAVLLVGAAGCAPSSDPTIDEDAEETDDALRVCADGPTVQGIDVSYWQGNIDWSKVGASGVDFAIVRVSDGAVFKDPKFDANWQGAKSAGLVRGVYQFFRPDQDPTEQADLMLEALASDPIVDGDLAPVLDIETTGGLSKAKIRARMQVWLDRVEAATGRTPIVYTAAFMQDVVGTGFSHYPLWVANYTTSCPLVPTGWEDWSMWQYSESGKVAGIKGSVDRNVFNGTRDDLLAFATATGIPVDPPKDPNDPPSDPPANPDSPTGLSPADGASMPSGSVKLSCDGYQGADSYAFEIQLYSDSQKAWTPYYTYTTSTSQKTFWPAVTGAYRFRVRATTAEGTTPSSPYNAFSYNGAPLP
ncbi:MAG: GH25 family lysozyme [Polyangiaceae bacterium]